MNRKVFLRREFNKPPVQLRRFSYGKISILEFNKAMKIEEFLTWFQHENPPLDRHVAVPHAYQVEENTTSSKQKTLFFQ